MLPIGLRFRRLANALAPVVEVERRSRGSSVATLVRKGADLSVYSQSDLHAISHCINTMLRRLHHSAKDRYDAAIALIG